MEEDVQVETLRAEHKDLEQQIDQEMEKPAPDAIRIQELKRQKLRIKDEIAKLAAVGSA